LSLDKGHPNFQNSHAKGYADSWRQFNVVRAPFTENSAPTFGRDNKTYS
jgi:hypothetical protein